jgi:BASS family bile acid:Na+ symporter
VLIPLTAGIAVNTCLARTRSARTFHHWIDAIGPLVSVIVIVLIVSCIVGLKKPEIARSAAPLFASVFVLHASGFLFGYLLARLLGCRESLRRTVSIEVGMQNSGLGAALASKHFAQYALAPVPAAISAVYHCLIGSLLAACWRAHPPKDESINHL